MEISVNNNIIPEKWVDFERNPGLAIACLVEAFNERLALLDNNQGFSVSSSIKFVQGFTAFDYDIILYLRDGISACLRYFYDMDYDEKHLEEHKGNLKMLDLNSFDKDTVDKFINIPPRGSLIGSFKDFYGACKAILQKMTAIHFTGDVYSLKEHYTSGTLHYDAFGNEPPIQLPIDWFKIMLEQTGNFTKTCNTPEYLDDVKYDYDYKVYNVYSTGNLCNLVYLGKKKEDGESRLKDIQYYKTSKNISKEIINRTGRVTTHIVTTTKVWYAFVDFVEKKASSYFMKRDVDYIYTHLVQGKANRDGYSVVDAFSRFEECLSSVDMSIFPTDIKYDINYIIEHFYFSEDNRYDFVVWHGSSIQEDEFDYYRQNIKNFINIDWEGSGGSDKIDAGFFFSTGVTLYAFTTCYYFLNYLDNDFESDWNYNGSVVNVKRFNTFDSDDTYYYRPVCWENNEFDFWCACRSYGAFNPLMFSADILYLNTRHTWKNMYNFSARFYREAVKIFYIDNKHKTIDCTVKVRYKISQKRNNFLYEYNEYHDAYEKYDGDFYGETIVTPTNLPSSLKIGWHKGAEFKWSEKINVDWLDMEAWIPSADDMKNFERGVGLCGIEGEIYIILDYKNGLKFK